jgi:hypothetical protein
MESSPKANNKRMDKAGILCLNRRTIFGNKQKTAQKWRAGDIPGCEPEENDKAGRENNESGTGYEELPEPGQRLEEGSNIRRKRALSGRTGADSGWTGMSHGGDRNGTV